MSRIKKEILAGNGNQFKIKEILQAHIQDQHEYQLRQEQYHKEIMEKFEKGSEKIATNRTSIFFLKIISFGSYAYTSLVIGLVYFVTNIRK